MKERLERVLVALSDDLVEKSINSACCWLFYQPELSDKLKKKYKK